MTKIVIDNQETDIDTSDCSCFKEILEKVCREKVPENALVTEVELNNEKLSDERKQELSSMISEHVTSLRVSTTQHLETMVHKTIKDIILFLDKMIPYTEEIAEMFRTKGEEEANKKYEKYLEELHLFTTAIDMLLTVCVVDRASVIAKENSIDSLQKKFLRITREMCDSQNNKDWVMLADLLEYELLEYMQDWQEVIKVLDEAVEERNKETN